MTYYNEQLLALQQQTIRKKRLEAKLQEYYAQRETLRERVRALEKIKLDEQQDVDRLEGHSLAAFFYASSAGWMKSWTRSARKLMPPA